jgi:hypothetical protein
VHGPSSSCDPNVPNSDPDSGCGTQLTSKLRAVNCLQENAKLHYGNPEEFTLTVPQFSIKPGEVVAVVGRVGCGEWVVSSKGCAKCLRAARLLQYAASSCMLIVRSIAARSAHTAGNLPALHFHLLQARAASCRLSCPR